MSTTAVIWTLAVLSIPLSFIVGDAWAEKASAFLRGERDHFGPFKHKAKK